MSLLPTIRSPEYAALAKARPRDEIMAFLSARLFPEHRSVFIHHRGDYAQIEKVLAERTLGAPAVIWQIEEDWLIEGDLDHTDIRKRIKASPHWHPESLVVTNCYRDYLASREWIKVEFRPALLDLIAYLPYDYDRPLSPLDNVRAYTAAMYNTEQPLRLQLFSFLETYDPGQFSLVKIGQGENLRAFGRQSRNEAVLWRKKENLDCPGVPVELDSPVARECAFGLEVESGIGLWGPTLSEKVYRWIHFRRPALILGAPRTRSYLKALGFDTWDWLINWDYDSIINPDERFRAFSTELDRLLRTPLEELKARISEHQDKLDANYARLMQLIDEYGEMDFASNYSD